MNLETEIRSGYSIPSRMKQIWSVQLQLLTKLLQVCKDNNLLIWADGGTLLGAIRHKGYIPWDDDIDLAMFRGDYDKLVQISQDVFRPPFFFQTAYSEKVPYPRGHAQLRMDNTTAILPFDIPMDFHQGIFIDIFPYDDVPNSASAKEQLIQDRVFMLNEMGAYTYDRYSLIHFKDNLTHYRLRKKINSIGFKAYFSSFEDLFRVHSDPGNKTVACLTFSTDLDKFQRDKEWYKETLMVPFEDIQIPIPAGYDHILTKQYGDYLTPVQAPSFHGGFAVLDSEKAYFEYLPELRRKRRRLVWKTRINKLLHTSL